MALFQGMKVGRVAQEGDEGGGKSLFSFITSNASGYSSESSSTASSPRALIFPARTGDASSSGASVVKVAASATKSTRKKRHGSLIRPGYARQDTSTEGSKTDLGAHDSPTSNSKSTLREEPEESTNNLDKSASVDRTSPENSKVPCQKLSTEERSDALRPDSRTSSSGDLPKDCQPARQDTAILNNQTKIEENLKEEKSSSTNPFESLTLDVADGEHVGEKTAVSGLESLSLDLSFDLDFDLDLDVTVPDSTGPDNLPCNRDTDTGLLDGIELDTLDLKAELLTDGDTIKTGADSEESNSVENTTAVKSSFTFLQSSDVINKSANDYDAGFELESCTEKVESSDDQPAGKSEAMKAENAAVVDGLPEETDTRDLQVVNLGSGDGESSSSDVTSRKDDDLVMTDSRIEDVQESSRLDEVRERFYSLQERHQSLLQTRVRLCCRQVKKRQELSRIKTEQDLAVKNEDYDKAEAFNRQLQSLTADLQVMTFDLPSSEPSLASLLEEMRHAMEEEVAMATEEAERYTAMKAREELCLKELKMTKQVELNREKQKLTTLQDQLAMAASHLSLDREHLQKSKAQLSSQVEERTAEFHSAKEQLVERRQDIQEEISALEEKLWVLRQEEEAVSAEIQLQEDGISRVEQQFSAERAQLEEERRTIDRKQGELEEQAREASREEQSLRDREAELQGEEERLQDSLQSIQERASHMTCQAQELSIRAEDMSALPVCTGVITTDNKQLTRLKEQQQERQREVQELTTQVLRFQTRVTDLNKQLGETTAQVPVLQEAKQLAVAGYNFSEAKRLADEIKDLEDKRVSKEEELVKARGDVKQLTQDLETSKKVLKEVQEELKQKEEEHDTARKDEAYRLYQELQLQLERCTNNIIRSVLQADMTACQLWIQDICEKHHLPLPQELQALDLHSILGEEDDIMVAMDTSCVRENGMSKAASSEETPTGAAGGSSTAEDCMQACDAADSSCPAEDYVQACEAISMRLLELEDQLQEAVGQEDYDAAHILSTWYWSE
ncbi:DISC1 [Branchiostoma lanceolatum]|uniref:DISC1 protein n=1 Tax=Branchiostoma lanceolatum TaxID=7740 RepID=A0A8J9ZUN3_BRALA|nr:DISC1 [Branchiostoma lanceolatum]